MSAALQKNLSQAGSGVPADALLGFFLLLGPMPDIWIWLRYLYRPVSLTGHSFDYS